MKIAIMQPYFFPYIGYFQLISAVDKFVIYDDVNFINKGWINRNNILVGGKSVLITFPLKESSQNKKIHDINTIRDIKVIEKLLKTISTNYKKAPYFDQVFEMIHQIFMTVSSSIAEFNLLQLKLVCNYLEITAQFVNSSSLYNNDNLKGEERIVDICIQEKAEIYINPIGGVELYNKNSFKKNDIKLLFIKSQEIQYKQFKNPFVPWLSIIDVLMFNSVEQTKEILKKYQLV